jgi:hypothetical protein
MDERISHARTQVKALVNTPYYLHCPAILDGKVGVHVIEVEAA